MQLQKMSLYVDILIVENQWIVETNVDLSIKIFLKWKRDMNQLHSLNLQDRDKWTNNG